MKMPNNKAPGRDLITHYWFKTFSSTTNHLEAIFKSFYQRKKKIPKWLAVTRTTLLPKNKETQFAKNYRPIACENNMFKIYTGILASFVNEHCIENELIFPEQAANKPSSWGCIDQLLINKSIMDEVVNQVRNIMCARLYYKKAYDSVSHEWIVESFRLAKISENIINAIVCDIMQLWAVKLRIHGENEIIESNEIKYLTGMLQGDTLSVIMFILCFNPLSHLLNKCDGYMMGTPGKRDTKITHLFFVDDLKLYSSNKNKLKLQIDTITKFSNDIGMQFGEEKCAYVCVEQGKRKILGKNIEINNVKIRELEEAETYKYLGIEETVQFNTALNKEKITKEYIKR